MGALHDDLRTSFSSSAAPSPQVEPRRIRSTNVGTKEHESTGSTPGPGGATSGGGGGGGGAEVEDALTALTKKKVLSAAEVEKVRKLMRESVR